MIFGYKPSQLKKAFVAGVGFLLTVLASLLDQGGVIPNSWMPYVLVFIGLCASYGVFAVRNVNKQAVAGGPEA